MLSFVSVARAQAPLLSAQEASEILDVLAAAPEHGIAIELPPRPAPRESPSAEVSRALNAAAVGYAARQGGRGLNWDGAPAEWDMRPAPRDWAEEFERARQSASVRDWLQGLAPRHFQYEALLAARARYAAIVEDGGWSALEEGPALREGDAGPRVAALRTRLVIEGFLSPEADDPESFDALLADAVRRAQRMHGLAEDGIAGAGTRAALASSAGDILARIDLNLERERWLPRPLPDTRIEVNIAAAELRVYRAGVQGLSMRAIVGAPRRRTPIFMATVEAVTLNPPWRVPASIAATEIMPRARRDPTYLARNGYAEIDGALIQAPGPQNALGEVKLELPNPHAVFVHDTPNRNLFSRDIRTLSHGCIRAGDARALAEVLLASQGVPRTALDASIAAGVTRRIDLVTPVPIFMLYRTAWVDETGALRLSRDVYGWDDVLAALMEGTRPQTPPAFAQIRECAG
ncbi:MAG: murein L,D-transpeptidase [Hyphomonadaceae bacterium]